VDSRTLQQNITAALVVLAALGLWLLFIEGSAVRPTPLVLNLEQVLTLVLAVVAIAFGASVGFYLRKKAQEPGTNILYKLAFIVAGYGLIVESMIVAAVLVHLVLSIE